MTRCGLILVLFVACPAAAQTVDGGRSVWNEVIELRTGEAEHLVRRASEAEMQGRTADALTSYRSALAVAPDHVAARAGLLRLLVGERRWAEILEATDELAAAAIGVGPDLDVDVVLALGARVRALAALGRYDGASDLLERLLRYRTDLPDLGGWYRNLAGVHLGAGRLERAALFYRHALSLAPYDAAARVGLAVALDQAGREGEARVQVLRAAIDDPSLGFLDRTDGFLFPDGMEALFRTLPALLTGDAETAVVSAMQFATSAAGAQAPDGYVDRVLERLSDDGTRFETTPVPGCTPLLLAISPDRSRLAVTCEYGSLQEVAAGRVVATSFQDEYGYYDYGTADLAYAPDGSAIRVLDTEGFVTERAREGAQLVERSRVFYDQYAVTPSGFVPGGERVLFTGASSGGFMVEQWDTTPIQPQLVYPTPSSWLYAPAISADERTIAYLEGDQIRVLRAPSWSNSATVPLPLGQSRFQPFGLSPDGSAIAVARGALLVRYAAATGEPVAAVFAGDVAPALIANPYEGVSAIEWVDDDTVAFGVAGAVHMVELR